MRKLSRIEQAFTLAHTIYPLTAICVLRIHGVPSVGALRQSLDRLQESQPLLSSSIIKLGNSYRFVPLETAIAIPLQIIERESENEWLEKVRTEINSGWADGAGPLMKVVFITSPSEISNAEILLAFHHAIADHECIQFLAETLLRDAGGMEQIPGVDKGKKEKNSSQFESRPPPYFKGLRILPRLVHFIQRQIAEERHYRKQVTCNPDNPIPDLSINDILTIDFSEEATETLIRWTREKRISLNSLIGSALIFALYRLRYSGEKKQMRLILFAGLRHYMRPSVPPHLMGCFISMLRFTIPVHRNDDLTKLALHLNSSIEKSIRLGDPFVFAMLSKALITHTIRKQDTRLGHVALSYVGPLQLQEQYGSIRLYNVHAFITNNRLGPEFTGFGKIFRGKLSLDLNFLSSEMTREMAGILASEVNNLLSQLIHAK